MSQDEIDPAVQELAEKLFNAAREGDAVLLAGYLDEGVPPNLTNGKGDTLLILAAYHTQADAVRVLLARQADTDRVNDNGQTALACAIVRNSAQIVTLLLDAGADPAAGHRSASQIARFFELDEMLALLELRGAS